MLCTCIMMMMMMMMMMMIMKMPKMMLVLMTMMMMTARNLLEHGETALDLGSLFGSEMVPINPVRMRFWTRGLKYFNLNLSYLIHTSFEIVLVSCDHRDF